MNNLHLYELRRTVWSYILDHIEPPTSTGCRLWTGRCNKDGYPLLHLLKRNHLVTRIVLEAKLGRPIDAGYLALHTCDTPRCVAADHLYEGTPFDNMQDALARKRAVVPRGKLSDAQIHEIRSTTTACHVLGLRYGVSAVTVWQARNYHTYKHLP